MSKGIEEDKISGELPGALALEIAIRKKEWPHTMDAKIWVEKWLETVKQNPDIALDELTIIGWFANAIMAGYDAAKLDN